MLGLEVIVTMKGIVYVLDVYTFEKFKHCSLKYIVF